MTLPVYFQGLNYLPPHSMSLSCSARLFLMLLTDLSGDSWFHWRYCYFKRTISLQISHLECAGYVYIYMYVYKLAFIILTIFTGNTGEKKMKNSVL